MDKGILYVIALFFIIGGIDYILGNRWKLGEKFEEGVKAMGVLGLGMIGIYSIAPLMAGILSDMIVPIARRLHLDPSIVPASFIAIDMGGYQLAQTLGLTREMASFSGVILASTLGATITFTIPIMLTMIQEEEQYIFSKGVMAGLIAIPAGCLAGGLYQGIKFSILMRNLIPIFVFSMLLAIGLLYMPHLFMKGFCLIGRGIKGISIIGLILQGINTISGVTWIPGLVSIEEVMTVVGKIAFVLGGAYPMIACLTRFFRPALQRCGKYFGINAAAVGGLAGNLASNLLVFADYQNMNDKGKMVCIASSVSMAFVFGGQLGFVSAMDPEWITAFMIAKLVGGLLSVWLALWIFEREGKEQNIGSQKIMIKNEELRMKN
ncbi:MAG: ethanolamine utilization protein EutH [Firmicutes bacterium]|nr:ethanolamine utilization protein EutH [Bacillota bacterium]